MKITKSLITLGVLTTFFTFQSPRIQTGAAQTSSTFPNDLVYVASEYGEEIGDFTQMILLVDANTLEATPIYQAEPTHELKPLAWSPDGNLLAIADIQPYLASDGEFNARVVKLCMASLLGSPIRCFQDHLSHCYNTSPATSLEQLRVSWSPDGSKIYFVTEDKTTKRLLEADVATGETIRTLYETASYNDDGPSILAWSPKLDYVADGTGLMQRTGKLVNLNTGATYNFTDLVTPYGYGSRAEMPQGSGYVCTGFSPRGTYIVAIDETAEQVLITDMELNVLYRIDNLGVKGSTYLECPVWNLDEQTLYIFSYNPDTSVYIDTGRTSLFIYSLPEKNLSLHSQDTVYSPFTLSPDETHFAFENQIWVDVLSPDGAIIRFGTPTQPAHYPLWRPKP
ncbi:MAG: hypothetical protein K8L91_06135 [Anaerolineae bacterium]|nr:hypothetical protein [Anaerolineae bacterium]